MNHCNTLLHCFMKNGQRMASRTKRVDEAHSVCQKVTALEAELIQEKEKAKMATENVKRLRAEKKQVSGSKKINFTTAGRGFPMPRVTHFPSTSTDKENNPFLVSSQPLPLPSFHIALSPELEPPQPSGSTSYGDMVPISQWQTSVSPSTTGLDSAPYPSLPPSTCPPSFPADGAFHPRGYDSRHYYPSF